MKSFLAVSVAPSYTGNLARPVEAAVACLRDIADLEATAAHVAATDHIEQGDDGWVAFAGRRPDDVLDGPGFTVRLSNTVRTRERDLATSELPQLISAGADLSSILPPFAVAHRDHRGAPVVIAGDWLGLRQLYWWSSAGVAAVSTSARALSILAGGGLDPVALGAQALIGWQVGDATPFAGVRALPASTVAVLHLGKLEQRSYGDLSIRPERAPRVDDAVEEMAEILQGWQTAYLDHHPDVVLQLTGGHDSRILLCAIPEKLRFGLRTLTLGDLADPDVRIAARLSQRYGMRHQVYRMDEQAWPTPAEANDLALSAARALGCQASPLALVPLLIAESQLEQGHRWSGEGGEVARGFYYAGQPAKVNTSPRLIKQLAQWRLFSNEAVEQHALNPEFLAEARANTLAKLIDFFPPGDWLRATDDFYLQQRMHRWAAAHDTVAAVRRHVICPMLDRRFIELALTVSPSDKHNSFLLGRLMSRLDPELASIALDSGLVPARAGSRTAAGRMNVASVTARKAARKVGQRLTRGRRPQLGAASASALVLEHWRDRPQTCAPLYESHIVNPGWLDDLLAGRQSAQPTTMAFLINLLAAA